MVKVINVKITDEETIEKIEKLREHYGIKNYAELIRLLVTLKFNEIFKK